jgi:short-subunit dehydrogenase
MDFNEQYGPWALIAGASEGLGAAFADECAQRGCNVVLIARRQELLEGTAAGLRERHGVETRTLVADLGRPDIGELVASVSADIDVGFFVYNAAFAPQGLFVNVPLDDLVTNIAVNITTPTVLSHMLGKKMVDRGRGGLVLVSSGAAHGGMKIFTTYAAAKAYELILGEGLWDEFRDHGVDALGYVVGATATPTFSASTEQDAVKATNARTPEEVAAQLFEVLGKGPRGYSHPGDDERAMAAAGRPRAEVVAATGKLISSVWS